jgi:hypothetical protein
MMPYEIRMFIGVQTAVFIFPGKRRRNLQVPQKKYERILTIQREIITKALGFEQNEQNHSTLFSDYTAFTAGFNAGAPAACARKASAAANTA